MVRDQVVGHPGEPIRKSRSFGLLVNLWGEFGKHILLDTLLGVTEWHCNVLTAPTFIKDITKSDEAP